MSALTLALPSKGRLQEQALNHLADAGLKVSQNHGARGYAATLSGADNVSLVLLSASEIASNQAQNGSKAIGSSTPAQRRRRTV